MLLMINEGKKLGKERGEKEEGRRNERILELEFKRSQHREETTKIELCKEEERLVYR